MNRLKTASSPYLLQHADNPVDWWPWSPEAFAEARERDVPLLISVGYAACHWCHVMAHESFADDDVAKVVNEHFVAIKVDREERPDVDAVYMTATQAMTGQGGWPMTVFATPDGQPFFCGTYFPRPTFVRLLHAVAAAWRDQRDAVVRQGAEVVTAIGGVRAAGPTTPMTEGVLDAAAASLAADTDGGEGLTYVWTPDQLREALGDADGTFAADLFGVTDRGTFEHGTSVLRLMRDLDAAGEAVVARARDVTARLRAARATRSQPGRDDKVVAAWTGLAITALVEAALVLPDGHGSAGDGSAGDGFGGDGFAAAAVRAGTLLADLHLVDGRLRRVSRGGVVGTAAGVLDDHGCVAEAFCALHQLTGEGRWLDLAGRPLDPAVDRFGDGRGGFYDPADDAGALVTRPADPTDNATPSGLSALAAALTTYTALTGRSRYREAAEAALATVAPIAARHARFTGYACAVGEAQLSGPYEIAIAGAGALVGAAWRLAPPGAVVVSGQPDQPGVPLLADRPMLGGEPTAYVCRGFVCDRPVTDVADLRGLLTR